MLPNTYFTQTHTHPFLKDKISALGIEEGWVGRPSSPYLLAYHGNEDISIEPRSVDFDPQDSF